MRILAGILLLTPALAAADRSSIDTRTVVIGPTRDGVSLARVVRPPTGVAPALAQSRIIYLNHNGVTLRPGDDDSRTQHSSIINSAVSVPAWNTSATTWHATLACFQEIWSRFDVTVTDVDPGNVPHMEAVFGGSPQDIGMPSGVGGVSPFTTDCGIIENSIVFTFTDVFPDDARTVCEVMSQEVAHSYGLDHELLASDPMTYLQYNGDREFRDQTVSCGEYSARQCGIDGSVCRANQNSVQLLMQRAGTADAVPPTLMITAPQDGATVSAGFEVDATASDNVAVTGATLYVDGAVAAMTTGAGPFTFPTDPGLTDGAHAVKVEVTDGKNKQSQTVNVTIGGNGSGSGSGSGGGGGGGGGDDDGGAHSGCSASGGAGWAFALVMLVALRRRRA
jgi:uncharacterized protein (TIGR03382 family)